MGVTIKIIGGAARTAIEPYDTKPRSRLFLDQHHAKSIPLSPRGLNIIDDKSPKISDIEYLESLTAAAKNRKPIFLILSPKNEQEAKRLIEAANKHKLPYLLLVKSELVEKTQALVMEYKRFSYAPKVYAIGTDTKELAQGILQATSMPSTINNRNTFHKPISTQNPVTSSPTIMGVMSDNALSIAHMLRAMDKTNLAKSGLNLAQYKSQQIKMNFLVIQSAEHVDTYLSDKFKGVDALILCMPCDEILEKIKHKPVTIMLAAQTAQQVMHAKRLDYPVIDLNRSPDDLAVQIHQHMQQVSQQPAQDNPLAMNGAAR